MPAVSLARFRPGADRARSARPSPAAPGTPAAPSRGQAGSASVAGSPAAPTARAARGRRSRVRKAGESAFGLVLLGQRALMLLVAVLLLVAGVWGSWGSAKYVLLDAGREHGTLRVERCAGERCTGTFVPSMPEGQPRPEVSAESSVVVRAGTSVPVVMKPDGKHAVRAGAAGLLYAWLPLAGALVLAATVVAGGLRWTRTAWALGAAGVALVTAAFVSL